MEDNTSVLDSDKEYIPNNNVQLLEMVEPGTKEIYFPPLNNRWTYEDLLTLPKSIEILYLGHDGVIYGGGFDTLITDEHIKSVLEHFHNLKEISVCGYYSQFSGDVDIFTKAGVKVSRIY